jgi:hypothetical protein
MILNYVINWLMLSVMFYWILESCDVCTDNVIIGFMWFQIDQLTVKKVKYCAKMTIFLHFLQHLTKLFLYCLLWQKDKKILNKTTTYLTFALKLVCNHSEYLLILKTGFLLLFLCTCTTTVKIIYWSNQRHNKSLLIILPN